MAIDSKIQVSVRLARQSIDVLLRDIAYDAKIEGNDGDVNDWRIEVAKKADSELSRLEESLSDESD